jgi:pyruvyltransferase
LIIKQGLDCPEVFGDPALLLPLFYKPSSLKKTHALGVVPHYVDKTQPSLLHFQSVPDVLVIDIQGGIDKVVDQIVGCERIVSSSLHGLIIADAYKIPSKWIKLSEKLNGSEFKFFDYFGSVGREQRVPLEVQTSTSLGRLEKCIGEFQSNIDVQNLLRSCPLPVFSRIGNNAPMSTEK